MSKVAVVTTFPNNCWQIYAKQMILSYTKYWPADIPLLVQLDDKLLDDQVQSILRPSDGVNYNWDEQHKLFVELNKDRDGQDYRKQAVRFCHKVFAIKHTLDAITSAKKDGITDTPRYLIWMDADVISTSKVDDDLLKKCLPNDGDAVAYLGRKDWDHSECGWLAFDLENGGIELIENVVNAYVTGEVFTMEQWHDSWVWDQYIAKCKATNLTHGMDGTEIWEKSPMSAWSRHYKGPIAKKELIHNKQMRSDNGQRIGNMKIETKNSRPNEEIKDNIRKNQAIIKNWLQSCTETSEDIVVVSAGPMLNLLDIKREQEAGKKIVAVKHALSTLEDIGVEPWACILLDPRPHVNDFVKQPNKNILWFVASQVEPSVTEKLLADGCKVIGYHAAVGADEEDLTIEQPDSIVSGGSATATRGLYVLSKLGFKNFTLYGYDLCLPDKPDMDELDQFGQPKNFEVSFSVNHRFCKSKRAFWSTAELLAQYQEMNDILNNPRFNIKAFGHGIVPFLYEGRQIGNLRESYKKAKLKITPIPYKELIRCSQNSIRLFPALRNLLRTTLLKLRKVRH